ncbi:MAG: glycerophosphodiester phosphodiesterase [Deltaproteobacteria bacterium]|nr:glycerophosphodiester phosphodiesterase [Deltaproteobacteria bacterium]
MKTRFFTYPLPRLIAHRGFSGRYPENTLMAFQAAVETGVSYLELDVWLSRDNQLVVHHDDTCQRTCGNPRAIKKMTLSEIKTLDAGFGFSMDGGQTFPFRGQGITIPSLEEVLTAFPKAFFTIEIKDDSPGIEMVLFDSIRRSGREDAVLIGSGLDEVMPRIRRHCHGIPTGCSSGEAGAFFFSVQKGETPEMVPGEVLHLPMYHKGMALISPPLVEAARVMGLEIHVWTVNKKEDMEKLLAQGVAGITSDFPDLLLEIAGNF